METQTFGWLLAQLPQLTARRCTRVQAQLGQGDARQQAGRLLDRAAQPQLSCPRCRACGKTFNSLSGTPLARDRNGRTLDYVTGRGPLTKASLHQCLLPALGPDILLVTDANAAYRAFAREAGISHAAQPARRGGAHARRIDTPEGMLKAAIGRFPRFLVT